MTWAEGNEQIITPCTKLTEERPELHEGLREIYREWSDSTVTTLDTSTVDETLIKINDLEESTAIEDVTDVFTKEA